MWSVSGALILFMGLYSKWPVRTRRGCPGRVPRFPKRALLPALVHCLFQPLLPPLTVQRAAAEAGVWQISRGGLFLRAWSRLSPPTRRV